MRRPDIPAYPSEGMTLEQAISHYETTLATAKQKREDEARNYEDEVERLRNALFKAILQAKNDVNEKVPSRLALTGNAAGMELVYAKRTVTITMRVGLVAVNYSDNTGQTPKPSDWQLSIKKPEDGTGRPCKLFVVSPKPMTPSRPLVDSLVDSPVDIELLHLFLVGILIPPIHEDDDIPF